ncbi:FHA domain-containing protein [Candidatus Woesearchaeota archaeon]|nr:FHA domain-containing protein [Candidatus Woesearchaeota archaeon]
MKTLADFVKETELHSMSRDAYVQRYRDRPPLFVHLNGEIRDEPDGETVQFGTLVLDPRKNTSRRNPLQSPVYPIEKHPARNSFGFFITVGRAMNNDIIVPCPIVSKFHGMITRSAQGYAFADYNSSNGSLLVDARGEQDCRPGMSMALTDRCYLVLASKVAGAELVFLEDAASIFDYVVEVSGAYPTSK